MFRNTMLTFALILLVGAANAFAQCPTPASITDTCIEVNGDAAMEGSFGLEAVMNGSASTKAAFVQDNTPDINDETVYRAQFLFDPNSIQMTVGTAHIPMVQVNRGPQGNRAVEFQIRRVPGFLSPSGYDVRLYHTLSAGGSSPQRRATSVVPILDGPNLITIEWTPASAPGVGDGFMKLTVAEANGANPVSVQRADLLTFGQTAKNVKLGLVTGIDPATVGSSFFDDFQSFRTLAP